MSKVRRSILTLWTTLIVLSCAVFDAAGDDPPCSNQYPALGTCQVGPFGKCSDQTPTKDTPPKCNGNSTYSFDDYYQCQTKQGFDCLDGTQRVNNMNCTWQYTCAPNAQGTGCIVDYTPNPTNPNPAKNYKVTKVAKTCNVDQPEIIQPTNPPQGSDPGPTNGEQF